ncbi:hypothetical protein G9F71_013305 [Clostridium sp. FP2]|uniref:hypothetical protein n=1 Tax=Clostridium sp. FP2 TaxID=2724481 RepID=UPI0013E947A5|nr:hypothetical protein [Clostridium sp. FP2]MBZ9623825.1 hypothetical protein [Clostridium sp. FP2]
MKKKKLLTIYSVILLIIIASGTGIYYKSNLDQKNKRQAISNNVVEYLLGLETFKYEVPEKVEVTYDKTMGMFIASVKFENNSRKATVIVSEKNEMQDISQ